MMLDDKDMVEINLSNPVNDGIELHARESYCLTKSLSITDLKDHGEHKKIVHQQKYATIAGVKCNGGEKLDSPNISCLRQMYCPDCGQRLDTESVRFETTLACCLPLPFPLNSVYKCCLKRSVGRKVICNKCGTKLGYWKRT